MARSCKPSFKIHWPIHIFLGISSGSSLGATFAILVGFGGGALVFQFGLAFGAFIGAIFASIFVLLLASVGSKMTSTKLVLSGMIISSLCSALSNLIIYLANNAEGMKDRYLLDNGEFG